MLCAGDCRVRNWLGVDGKENATSPASSLGCSKKTADTMLNNFLAFEVFDSICAESKLMAIVDILRCEQGNRAIAEIQFADYIYPAIDQVRPTQNPI